MDLSKLTPAPWKAEYVNPDSPRLQEWWEIVGVGRMDSKADADFAILARQAFDVMMRRGWTAMKVPNGWAAVENADAHWAASPFNQMMWAGGKVHLAADPWTALVEADRWMREQEAKG